MAKALSIRRGTTKRFMFTIPPFCSNPDTTVDSYSELPAYLPDPEDIGKVYKVLMPTDKYPERSYYRWNGNEWNYIGSDTLWKSLGTIIIRLVQGTLVIDKKFNDWQEDVLTVEYTQDDTIKLFENKSAKIQVLSVDGDISNESALKSQTYQISVLDSLWDEAVHNE